MSAILYELTSSAAQMCTPVPAAAAVDFTDWLDHWQTLLGAGAGGLLGVGGAWIVAGSQRSREQRIAAGMVLPDLHQLAAAGEHLRARLVLPAVLPAGITEAAARATAAVDVLTQRRPTAFALHTPVIGQLTDIDARLYSHLFQCEMTHRMLEEGIATWQARCDAIRPLPQPRMTPPRYDTQLYDAWERCAEHATLAAYFLDRLMFSRWPRWMQRLRMKWRPNDLDGRSIHLLTKGELLADAAPPGGPAATVDS